LVGNLYFQHVEQQVNDNLAEALWSVLANPADTQLHINELQELIKGYPQSNLLHVLAARSNSKEFISNAAIYFNGQSLYRLTNNGEPLPTVNTEQLVSLDKVVDDVVSTPAAIAGDSNLEEKISAEDIALAEANRRKLGSETNWASFTETPVVSEAPEDLIVPEPEPEKVISENPVAEQQEEILPLESVTETEPVNDTQPEAVLPVEPAQELSDWQPTQANINPPAEPFFYGNGVAKAKEPVVEEQAKPLEPVINQTPEVAEVQTPQPEESPVSDSGVHQEEKKPQTEPVEDEVYDEIVSIDDIQIEQPVHAAEQPPIPAVVEEESYYTSYTEQPKEEVVPVAEAAPRPAFDLDDQITESIYATDYFAFKDSLVEEPVAAIELQAKPEEIAQGDENQTMAKYHDDNLPYSFLWWLDKTRREHSNLYQPYAKPAILPGIDELTEDKDKLELSLPDPKQKEEEIIERFIQAEPQIKPPAGDKLDNENKARNSAEDSDELVTETLARIYTDQMLYHKAIATYKKLMLRYPEKSSYFAGQIENLENKIN
jgi:hypothetical protein